jgi:PKD repeat protein
MTSIVGTAAGLSNTDAFFNLQQDGTIFLSPRVSILNSGGEVSAANGQIIIEVDLVGVQRGAATLYFDLLGFGPDNAEVIVDSVELEIGAVTAPVAQNDAAATDMNVAVIIDILANDSDSDGVLVASTVAIVTAPLNGSVLINPVTGAVTYTPNLGFAGMDSFTYTVEDNDGAVSNQATVTIAVGVINVPPVANNDDVTTDEDTPLVIDVLANDTDDNAIDPTSVTIITAPTHGTLDVNPLTGEITYTPNANFFGADTFTYTVQDNDALTSNEATVTITVNPVNDAPVANDDEATTDEDTPVLIIVLGNDTDLDGTLDATTVAIVSQPANGTLDVNPLTGEITYTPNANFFGTDSFAYTVRDNEGVVSNEATVTIIVNSVNDAPTADAGPDQTVNEGDTVQFDGSASSDVEDADLEYEWDFGDGNTATGASPTHTYATVGLFTVTLTVRDSEGATSTDRLTVTVSNVAPVVALDGDTSGARGQPLAFVATVTDIGALDGHEIRWDFGDGAVIDFQPVTNAGALSQSHAFTQTGTFIVTVTIREGGVEVTQTLAVTITAIAQPPGSGGTTDLIISGTNDGDFIYVNRYPSTTPHVIVFINRRLEGIFSVTGRIIIYGLGGDDYIWVNPLVTSPALLDGGTGNDTIEGGGGNDLIYGDVGNDVLSGGRGHNLIIGGGGEDIIDGGGRRSVLVGGKTIHDPFLHVLLPTNPPIEPAVLWFRPKVKAQFSWLDLLGAGSIIDDGTRDVLFPRRRDNTDFGKGLHDLIYRPPLQILIESRIIE